MSKGCRCCADGRAQHKDFIRGGVDESDFEPDFRPVSLKKKRPRGFCAKEKELIPCQDTIKVVDWRYWNSEGIVREHGHYECIKCHRYQSHWYRW